MTLSEKLRQIRAGKSEAPRPVILAWTTCVCGRSFILTDRDLELDDFSCRDTCFDTHCSCGYCWET